MSRVPETVQADDAMQGVWLFHAHKDSAQVCFLPNWKMVNSHTWSRTANPKQ